MSDIELNNKNNTKINFNYDYGLPYKKSIRPDMEYGDWLKRPKKTILKVYLSDNDYQLFDNPENINGIGTYIIGHEIWFDLEVAYLIMSHNDKIENKRKQLHYCLHI